MSTIELSLKQCRELHEVADLRELVESLNDQPEWMPEAITDLSTIFSVVQGGCASGAYMPAVTYYTASKTMGEHGDAILEYIENHIGEVPALTSDDSWGGYCCKLLSAAVELWCGQFADYLWDYDISWD